MGWYYPRRNYFVQKSITKDDRGNPIPSKNLLLEVEELRKIKEFKKRLLKEKPENQKYDKFYLSKESEFVEFLRGLSLKKLRIFIRRGLPQKNGCIQVPFLHKKYRPRELDELRVLEGLEISKDCSGSDLETLLKKRKRELKENEEKRARTIFWPKKRLKVDQKPRSTPQSRRRILEEKIDLTLDELSEKGCIRPISLNKSTRADQRPHQESSELISIPSNSKSLNGNPEPENFKKTARKSTQQSPSTNKSKIGMMYHMRSLKEKQEYSFSPRQLINKYLPKDYPTGDQLSDEERIWKFSLKIAFFENAKVMAQLEEHKGLQMANRARRLIENFDRQIQEFEEERDAVEI